MKKIRSIINGLVVLVAISAISNAENTMSSFASSEILKLKEKGLNTKHPIILKLQSIVDENDEDAARIKVLNYLESTIGRDGKTENNKLIWIKIRSSDKSDKDQIVDAKRKLLDALNPFILSGKIIELKALPDGFLFSVHSGEIKNLGGLEYKLGYNFSFEVISK